MKILIELITSAAMQLLVFHPNQSLILLLSCETYLNELTSK